MPSTLSSDMARKSFAVLLERVERRDAFSSDEVRELLNSCEMGFLILERLGLLARGLLDRGMEGRKLTFLLKELLDVLEVGVKAFETAGERLKASDLAALETADGLAVLERYGRRTAEMRKEWSSLLGWLETPRSEIDPATLPAGREEREANGYINLDDVTARLLSGGNA